MKKVQKLVSVSAVSLMALSQISVMPVAANQPDAQIQEETQALENVALNKPTLGTAGNSSRAVDGDISTYWDGGPAPSELFVDLEKYYDVSSINVVPYYAGSRTYHYEVYVSSNGSTYKKVGEKTDDATQTSAGETYEMNEEGVRYVKVRMTYNSANPSVHINELRVYGVENPDYQPPETPSEDLEDPDNIAYGKPVRTNTNSSFASLVNDGSRDTAWSGEDYPKFVDIDLGENYDLSAVKVYMPMDGQYAYNVYTSTDGVHFDKVHESAKKESAQEGDLITFDQPVTARVIRTVCMANSAGEGAASRISEVRAYGSKSAVETTPTRTSLDLQSYDDWMQENYGIDIASLRDASGNYDVRDTFDDQDVYNEVYDLIGRVLGDEYKDWFSLELAPLEDPDADYYELSMQDGKVHIKGNEGISLTSGLNHYLKYYCNVHVSQQRRQTQMPEVMPVIEGTVRKDSPYEVRYAYNYCTLSYTMPFWGYDEWQQEMDYFALNGVNLILDTTATEALWVEYLQNYGYSVDEAKDFVCGYSYKAWWLMGNLEGYGGPVSDEWIKDTVQMARVNQRRMHILGMQPCLQGFMGAMPENFGDKARQVLLDEGYDDIKNYMVEQGDWSGFTRPPILKTTYNGWDSMAKKFYETQEKIYGQATKYYAGDLAHEGGIIPPDLSKPEMSAHILSKMMEYDPDAVWVIQSWLSNPNKEILEGFGENKEDHVIVLDLDATENPHWSNTTNWNGKEFGGTGWVFCMLDNYGGRTGLHGELEYLATQITKANASSEHMKGIGITPEGTLLNPVNYDLFWEMAWESEAVDVNEWLDHYIERRYGKSSDSLRQAWDILLDTAYSYNREDGSYKYHTGNNNCITNMRPSFNPEIVIGSYDIPYDAAAFEKVMDLMMDEYDELKGNECYVYDMVDILRQSVANAQVEYFYRIKEAYDTGNLELFEKYKDKMLESILRLDEIAAFEKDSLYGTWISKAVNFAEDERNSQYDDFSKDLMVINAKAICSIWSSKTLQTYGHRQYAGMEKDYNYPMWKLWLDRVETAMKGGSYAAPSSNVDYFNIGWDMVTNGNLYSTTPTPIDGDTEHRSMREVYQDVRSNFTTVEARKDKVIDENIAPDATAYAETTLGSYRANRINDGDSGTLWIAGSSKVPVYCGLTFPSKKEIYAVTLVFEPRNPLGSNIMKVDLQAKNADGTYETIWSGQNYNEAAGSYTTQIEFDSSITTEDLRLVYSTNGGIYPALAEMKVYASSGITLLDGSDLFISHGAICGIPDGWTTAQVKEWLKIGGGELVFKRGDTVLGDEDLVQTGDEVQLVSGANVLDHYSLSLASDLTKRLGSLMETCKAVDEDDYSNPSLSLLKTRMEQAQAVMDNASSKPNQYRSALEALQRAYDGLVSIAGYAEDLAALEAANTNYLSASNKAFFKENLEQAKAALDGLKDAESSEIYTAKAAVENAQNAVLPADHSNIARKGTVYADNSLMASYGPAKMNNGSYSDCWVTNSQTNFPVKGGITLAQASELSGIKVVFEQNGYRNTRIGYVLSVQLEDGSWQTLGEGECGSKNGYTFFYDLKDLEGKVKDVRVTLTSWATDAGSPYPGIAELEIYEKTDQSALTVKTDALKNVVFEDEAAAEALEKARYASGNILVSQNFVNEAAAGLNDSLTAPWKESIKKQIASINPSQYTPASAAVWNEAVTEVKAGLDAAADFDAMAALQAKLDAALAQLVKAANKTLLNQAVSEAERLKAEGALEGVNTLVVKAFDSALNEAKAIQAEETAEQSEVNEAWIKLTRAIQMLSFTSDKTELNRLIAKAQALDLNEYAQDEALEEFKDALVYALQVAEDETALNEGSISLACTRLQLAMDNLHRIVSVDTRVLEFLVEQADSLDLSLYVSQGQDAFKDALAAAKTVLENPQSQQDVDGAVDSLSDAYLNLRLKADESLLEKLRALKDEIESLDLSQTDKASAAMLKDIANEIGAALNNPDLSADGASELITKAEGAIAQFKADGRLDQSADAADVNAGGARKSSAIRTGVTARGWIASLGAAGLALLALGKKRRKWSGDE